MLGLSFGLLRIKEEPFNLRACLENVTEMMSTTMMKEAVKLHCLLPRNLPEQVMGDAERFRQIVSNLLSNAIKFTHHGEITLAATCKSESLESVTVRVEIRDTGIGIEKGRQKAVFESFTQAEGSFSRRHDGAGLGLTLAKQIVELMGGQIHLKSKLGEGTTVSIEIAFAKPPERVIAKMDAPDETNVALGLKVLVAEDNPVNSIVLVGRLEKWACECIAVENGIDALKALSTDQIDLVLMDVSMPEMDGIEATKQLRRLEAGTGSHTPVIAVTAHAMDGDREKCLSAGMDDYIPKPINFTDLLRVLQDWKVRSNDSIATDQALNP